MRRATASDERGFTLVETLMAAAMAIGVLGATLTTLTDFSVSARNADARNDAQQEARLALGLMAGELRNLASPTNELPHAVEQAEADDLVFLSVAQDRPDGSQNLRNTVRVRFCLDASTATLWRQEQNWTGATPPAVPATAACPAIPSEGGWEQARAAAGDVRNADRPVFTYNGADLVDITEVHASLFIDTDPAVSPAEVAHETKVFLRNQNRGPVASFTATTSGSQILLNGSDSHDPEGRALEYHWYDNGVSEPVGEGIVFTYSPSQPGNHSIQLKVTDPAGLESAAPAQEVCIVGGLVTC